MLRPKSCLVVFVGEPQLANHVSTLRPRSRVSVPASNPVYLVFTALAFLSEADPILIVTS